jgi:hypothetical protein
MSRGAGQVVMAKKKTYCIKKKNKKKVEMQKRDIQGTICSQVDEIPLTISSSMSFLSHISI